MPGAGPAGWTSYHVTREPPEDTMARMEAAGWRGTLLPAAQLGEKYGFPDHQQAIILGQRVGGARGGAP